MRFMFLYMYFGFISNYYPAFFLFHFVSYYIVAENAIGGFCKHALQAFHSSYTSCIKDDCLASTNGLSSAAGY